MSNQPTEDDQDSQPQQPQEDTGDFSSLMIKPPVTLSAEDKAVLFIEDRPSGTLNLSEAARQIGVSEEFLSNSSNHPWLPSEISSDRRQYFSMLDVARYQAHMNTVRKRVEADQQRQRQQAMNDVFDAVRRGQQKGKRK